MKQYIFAGRARVVLAGVMLGAVIAGCAAQDTLLQAVDPDLINPSDLNSPDGAEALRVGALGRLRTITAGGESMWLLGGMMTDEWKSGDTFAERDETDKRSVQYTADKVTTNGNVTTAYRQIHIARSAANQAIVYLRKFKPLPASNVAEMFFVKGYAELIAAESFCNGQPFATFDGPDAIPGPPMTDAEAYAMSARSFDSVLAVATGTDAASIAVQNAAKLGKARALMNIGGPANYAAAKALVAGIPTAYRYNVTFVQISGDNQIWALANSARRWVVGDSVDPTGTVKNALPFVSANDPRVPTLKAPAVPALSFDVKTPFVTQGVFLSKGAPAGREDPAAIVAGLDARLLEAEVALSTGDNATWLATLNALRAAPPVIGGALTPAGLAPLVDPGNAAARLSLQFREKAFWTYARGERLGDMRRLIRQYGRTQDTVFPTGPFFKLDNYGTDVNFPVPQAEQNNANFVGLGCTDRNA
ncbi:MAG: hypothetical protein JWL61_4469 [Gemmatimonadetes bacterium]|jgi:hypothetical protein|nr:hypothetical protein [Gemmatimonadota bacterium]